MDELERSILQRQIDTLKAEIEVLHAQWAGTLDEGQRLQIDRQIALKLGQIKSKTSQIQDSGTSPTRPSVNQGNERASDPQSGLKSGVNFTEDLGSGVKLEMIAIPNGAFDMGDPGREGDDNEKPQHRVSVPAFWMGKYPITQAQYKVVMGENPARFKNAPDSPSCPVEQVSWHDAKQFCEKLSQQTGRAYRLPSEAEWEYACRAGATTSYSFGDSADRLKEYAWFDGNSDSKTHPVGQKKPNLWGLYDMHGNIWEWCEDMWHGNYKGAPSDGSAWITGDPTYRLLRGGSWLYDPWYCRSAYRYSHHPVNRYDNFGFRVVSWRARTHS